MPPVAECVFVVFVWLGVLLRHHGIDVGSQFDLGSPGQKRNATKTGLTRPRHFIWFRTHTLDSTKAFWSLKLLSIRVLEVCLFDRFCLLFFFVSSCLIGVDSFVLHLWSLCIMHSGFLLWSCRCVLPLWEHVCLPIPNSPSALLTAREMLPNTHSRLPFATFHPGPPRPRTSLSNFEPITWSRPAPYLKMCLCWHDSHALTYTRMPVHSRPHTHTCSQTPL